MNTLLVSAYNVAEFVIQTGVHVILRDLTNYYWKKDRKEIAEKLTAIDNGTDHLQNEEIDYLITPENLEILKCLEDEGSDALENNKDGLNILENNKDESEILETTNCDGPEPLESLEYNDQLSNTPESDQSEIIHIQEDDASERLQTVEDYGSDLIEIPTDYEAELFHNRKVDELQNPQTQSETTFLLNDLGVSPVDINEDETYTDIYTTNQLNNNIDNHTNEKVHVKEIDILAQENPNNFNEEDFNIINIQTEYNVKLKVLNNMVSDLEEDLKHLEETDFHKNYDKLKTTQRDDFKEHKAYVGMSNCSKGDHNQIPQREFYFGEPIENFNQIVYKESSLTHEDQALGLDCTSFANEYRSESGTFLTAGNFTDLNGNPSNEIHVENSYTVLHKDNIMEAPLCDCRISHACLQYISSDDEDDIVTDNEELLSDEHLDTVDTGSVSDWLYRVNPDIIRQSSMNTSAQENISVHSDDLNLTYEEEIFLKNLFIKKWLDDKKNNFRYSCYGSGDYNEF